MKKGFLGITLTFLVVAFTAFFVFQNRYNIYDWAKLRNYKPTAPITALATTSGMNNYGTKLFYVNDPQISDKTKFNAECRTTEQTIVLGCYTGTNIYVYKVDDPKLQGVEEVTAAHEMLHAAYQRLSSSEKSRIDGLLQAAYARVKDKQLTDVMASYQKTEPGEQDNELHSILGTEYSNLGSELEDYYKKYFADRAKVVKLANDYKKVFEDISKQVEQYDADLSLRKSEINQRQSELASTAKQLETQKAQMDVLLRAGNAKEYNAQVNIFNQRVTAYNAEVKSVKMLIEEYNKIVEARNNLTVQQEGLAQSLDSRIETIK